MSTFHVIKDCEDSYSLRSRWLFPEFDLPQTTAYHARWVILTKPICVYANVELVKQLCDRYGKDRLVLMDCSDQGNGDYPCTVFAANCRHDWPKNVIGYIQPAGEQRWLQCSVEGGVRMEAPRRVSKRFTVSFCGDVSSHPCRRIGADIIAKIPGHFLKLNPDGWSAKEMAHVPLDGDYNTSFDTSLMWCPPSRRVMTHRLSEAMAAGVPVLCEPFWEKIRLPQEIDFFRGLVGAYNHDNMNGFETVLRHAISNPFGYEMEAENLRELFAAYSRNFWPYVAQQLAHIWPPLKS